MSIFQGRLKEVMEEKDIKAADISRATGLSPAAISKYLSIEDKKVSFENVIKIADFLNVDPSWLGGATDKRKPFRQPEIIQIYEQLSEDGKNKVFEFASFVLNKEKEG